MANIGDQKGEETLHCHETGCKFGRKEKKSKKDISMTRCTMCYTWFHDECVGIEKESVLTIWPCPICRSMSKQVKQLISMVSLLTNAVNELKIKATENQASLSTTAAEVKKTSQCLDVTNAEVIITKQKCDELLTESGCLKQISKRLDSEHTTALTTIKSIDETIKQTKTMMERSTNPENDSDQDSDNEDDVPEAQGDLLIGDSLIRDVQPVSGNLTVESHGGAKFNDLRKRIKNIKPNRRRYKNIYIVCGTNDISTKKPVDRISKECEKLLDAAKVIADKVHLSSILPRTDEPHFTERIPSLNDLLSPLAESKEVSFINNDQNFTYRNGTVDGSLLSPADGLHLSSQGVAKLLLNLKIQEGAKAATESPTKRWDSKQMTTRNEDPPTMPTAPPPFDDPLRKVESQPIKFKGPGSSFSNFYAVPLHMWGMTFASSEHAFQYRKAVEMNQHVTAEKIRQAPTARDAQLVAKTIQTNDRWSHIKQSVMYELIQEKAKQCPTFHKDLQASEGRLLVEDTPHEYWGRGQSGSGLNMLGRLLMTLRENLSPVQEHRPTNPHGYAQPRKGQFYPRRNEQQPRCFNCGEKSHNVKTCRHPSPIQCHSCFKLGHKQKFCFPQKTTSDYSHGC